MIALKQYAPTDHPFYVQNDHVLHVAAPQRLSMFQHVLQNQFEDILLYTWTEPTIQATFDEFLNT